MTTMRRVGVTGGGGFIGGHLVQLLASTGHEVVVFDRRRGNPELTRTLAELGRLDREAVTTFLGDVTDQVAVTEFAAHVDGVIHLASVLGTQETINDPRPAVHTNTIGALNVFEACSRYGLPVVNICVGNRGMANPYSASKTMVETLGRMYRDDRGLRVNQVRAVNAYGPRQVPAAPFGASKVRKIMPSFVCRALTGAPIEVYGSGNQVSEMVWVGDVAKVLARALEHAADGHVCDDVVEIGGGDHANVGTIASLVAQECAYDPVTDSYPHEAVPIRHLPMRPGETPGVDVIANNVTLEMLGLDWRGWQVPLHDGIRKTVEWYRRNWLPGWVKEQRP